MTGYISGIPDPLSTVTIGTLQDMGYSVNYAAADPYTLPGHVAAVADSGPAETNTAQLGNGFDNAETLGFDNALTPTLVSDQLGNGGSGTENLALFASYLVSTFVTSPGEVAGALVAAQPSGHEEFLTRPLA